MEGQKVTHWTEERLLWLQLHNREVQSACVKALRDDQAFQGILNSPDTAPITVPITKVLPSGSFVEVGLSLVSVQAAATFCLQCL